jgi:hypothetical protein
MPKKRKSLLKKSIAIFLLLLTLQNIVQPMIAMALTTGPHQPEYISYEQPGSTDMVNLLTGDFTFSLPLLEVPGPEGSFSVPLTYNAGIGLEQEASWVGLGWTLNVGAITRDISQYPDDATGELQSINNVNLVGVRGWTSSCLGLGQIGWNNVSGGYGAISILGIVNYQWDAHHSSGGLIGINVGNGGIDFNPAQFGMAVISIATMGAGAAAASEVGEITMSGMASQAALGLVQGAVLSPAFPSNTPALSPTAGYWTLNKKFEHQGLFHSDYWIWMDQTRYEQMYGVLNLDKTGAGSVYFNSVKESINSANPVNVNSFVNDASTATGTASDINYYMPPNTAFVDANSAALLATDNFHVKAPGISGAIKPYRFDVGSVSMPRAMDGNHVRFNTLPWESYKTPFIYEGSISSSYLYHTGAAGTSFNYGLSASWQLGVQVTNYSILGVGTFSFTRDFPIFNLSDNIFNNGSRVRSDVSSNYKLPQENHIEWLSNSEIIATAGTFTNGFMDYFSSSSNPSRVAFRSSYPFVTGNFATSYTATSNVITPDGKISLASSAISNFSVGSQVQLKYTVYNTLQDYQNGMNGVQVPLQNTTVSAVDNANNQITVSLTSGMGSYLNKYASIVVMLWSVKKQPSSIGGFSITSSNGITYHFALPIYDYQSSTWIGDKTNPGSIYATVLRNDAFANTWLLTGITGSDFVDRNSNGIIDETDWGYWVKFNYGKYSDNHQWKVPFGNGTSTIDPTGSSLTYSQGVKQLFYLNSIETRSHVALFFKGIRDDNYDATTT